MLGASAGAFVSIAQTFLDLGGHTRFTKSEVFALLFVVFGPTAVTKKHAYNPCIRPLPYELAATTYTSSVINANPS